MHTVEVDMHLADDVDQVWTLQAVVKTVKSGTAHHMHQIVSLYVHAACHGAL